MPEKPETLQSSQLKIQSDSYMAKFNQDSGLISDNQNEFWNNALL